MQPTLQKRSGKANFWRVAAGSFWVRFSAVWFVAGALFLGVGLMLILGEWRYRTDGVTSQALVTKLITNRDYEGDSYRVDYRFETPQGRVDGSSQIPLEIWRTLHVNDSVVVVYRGHDSGANRVQGHDNRVLIAIFTPMGAFFFSIGALLLVKSLRDLRKRMSDGAQDSTHEHES